MDFHQSWKILIFLQFSNGLFFHCNRTQMKIGTVFVFSIVYWPILKCQLMTIVKTSRQSSFEILLDFCIFFPMLAATGAASSSAATQRVALAPLCRSPRSSHGVRFSALLLRASTAVGASLVPSVQVGSPADQKPYEFCSIFFSRSLRYSPSDSFLNFF